MRKQIKKIIPYLLILLIIVGLFSPMVQVEAQTPTPAPTAPAPATPTLTAEQQAAADKLKKGTDQNGLFKNMDSCFSLDSGLNMEACIQQLFYFFLVVIPSWLLALSAMFFNSMLAIGLNSEIFHAPFVSQAWTVVRDFSNIFFILVLLYVAIQTILGLSHETKKIIVHVIIMALLINFSMFFSKVVIDSSNILALVFYNKIAVNTGTVAVTKLEEKDISGLLANAFKPYQLLSPEFFERAKEATNVLPTTVWQKLKFAGNPIYSTAKTIKGLIFPTYELSAELIMGIQILSGLIMLFAAYSFFIVGLTFIARLIELWILIIFSPFAFMSFTIPKLAGVSYIGWEEWLKRILKLSFMAPIFMFFLYLIAMLVKANPFNSFLSAQTTWEEIFFVLIPALVILILLRKATKWAKDASGEMGEAMMKGLKITAGIVGGVGGGLALGGVAALGQATLGKKAFDYANSAKGKEQALKGGWEGFKGKMKLRAATYGKDSTFDARKGVIGAGLGAVERVTGINLGKTSKFLSKGEGYETDRRNNIAKKLEEANRQKVSEDEELMQKFRRDEIAHQNLLKKYSGKIDEKEREIKGAEAKRDRLRADLQVTDRDDPEYKKKQKEAQDASQAVLKLYAERKKIKGGEEIIDEKTGLGTGKYRTDNGLISQTTVDSANEEARNAADAVTRAEEKLENALKAQIIASKAVETAVSAEDKKKAQSTAVSALDAVESAAIERDKSVTRAATAAADLSAKATAALAGTGNSINDYEDVILPSDKHNIHHENQKRMGAYANNMEKSEYPWGMFNYQNMGANEASEAIYRIRMGMEAEHKGKKDGGGGDTHIAIHAPSRTTHAPKPSGDKSGGGGASHGPAKH